MKVPQLVAVALVLAAVVHRVRWIERVKESTARAFWERKAELQKLPFSKFS